MSERPRLRKYYEDVVVPDLSDKYGNPMEVPGIRKVVVNFGLGGDAKDRSKVKSATEVLKLITGQQPVITRAKRSISSFHLRKGQPVGMKVTLRKNRMYEFLDRLINVAIPRIRDFRGLNPDSFDGHGNYTFGISEQFVFPEIEYEQVKEVFGMDITLVTSADSDEQSLELLTSMGMPFRIEEKK